MFPERKVATGGCPLNMCGARRLHTPIPFRALSTHRNMPKEPLQHLAYFMHRLQRLKNYVQFSETNWKEKLASYNASLENDDLNIESFGGRRDHWADLANEFPQYHRKASFLMIFAMLEDDLTEFCKAVAAEQRLTTAVSNTHGRGIERAKVYLTKIGGFPFPASTPEWQKIKVFGDVRNVLIHAAGYLEPGNAQHERVKKAAEECDSGLCLHRHARSQISLELDFLPSVIATLESFYELLLAATKKIEP